jgi:hypothetical protein
MRSASDGGIGSRRSVARAVDLERTRTANVPNQRVNRDRRPEGDDKPQHYGRPLLTRVPLNDGKRDGAYCERHIISPKREPRPSVSP